MATTMGAYDRPLVRTVVMNVPHFSMRSHGDMYRMAPMDALKDANPAPVRSGSM